MNGYARTIQYIDFKDSTTKFNRMVSFQEGGIKNGMPFGLSSYIDKRGNHSMGLFDDEGNLIK